jgi:hypothetical protein
VINSFINMVLNALMLIFYGKVLRITIQAKRNNLGRSSGVEFYSSVIARLAVIVVTLLVVLVPSNILLVYIGFLGTENDSLIVPLLLLFCQQGRVTPPLYTFSTRGFRIAA